MGVHVVREFLLMQTPKGQIVHALRLMWLRSRERGEALKNAKYCCQKCGVKKSTAIGKEQKVEVHHKNGVGNWDSVIELIRKEILCEPEFLEVLCPDCHEEADNGTAGT